MTKRERSGPLPFSESDFHHYSRGTTTSVGALWQNAPDGLLVGLVGQSYGRMGGPEEWILGGARAELQRRQIDATTELTDVQRTLLQTIEDFNQRADTQTAQMVTLTRGIKSLTWLIAFLAAAQLLATLVQMWPTVRAWIG